MHGAYKVKLIVDLDQLFDPVLILEMNMFKISEISWFVHGW